MGRPVLWCLGLASLYVAPFYLRSSFPRNHPATIVFRMVCGLAACSTSWMPLQWMLEREASGRDEVAMSVVRLNYQLLGLRTTGFMAALCISAVLVCTLFLGTIVHRAFQSHNAFLNKPWNPTNVLEICRNLVVGPVSEEVVFRAAMVPLFLLEGWRPLAVGLIVPLFFGVAHLHHMSEYVIFQRVPLQAAAFRVAFQFAYTTVFGWFAVYLFVRTGNLAAPVAAHMVCNYFGFPDFLGALGHRRKRSLIVAYLIGIAGFVSLLQPLTAPAIFGNASEATGQNSYLALAEALHLRNGTLIHFMGNM